MAKSLFNPNSLTSSFLRLTEQTPAPSGGVASRTLLQTGGGKSLVFSFDAGQELSEHTNPNHAILCGLTGTVQVTAGADVYQLDPGDRRHLPPKLVPSVKAAAAASFQLQLLAPDPAL